MYFTIYVTFSDSSGNQLIILTTKIKYDNHFLVHVSFLLNYILVTNQNLPTYMYRLYYQNCMEQNIQTCRYGTTFYYVPARFTALNLVTQWHFPYKLCIFCGAFLSYRINFSIKLTCLTCEASPYMKVSVTTIDIFAGFCTSTKQQIYLSITLLIVDKIPFTHTNSLDVISQ